MTDSLDVNRLILRLQSQHPGDVGIFAVYFLNCFKCMSLSLVTANVPHF
jgi:hypothetical protein